MSNKPYWEFDGNIKDFQLSAGNIQDLFDNLQKHLAQAPFLLVNVQNPKVGKWGMAKLWRMWMATTGEYMAEQGCTQPLYITPKGKQVGKRPFNEQDAHELFTSRWMGLDDSGERLSWSKKGHDGMRVATKGERWNALRSHEQWAMDKGIKLFIPRDSEYRALDKEQNQ